MDLRDKVTDNEKSLIEYYIDNYALEGKDRTVSIDYILREWNDKKHSLFHLLEDNLILSKEITFEKDEEQLAKEIYYDVSCSTGKGSEFVNAFYALLLKFRINSQKDVAYHASELVTDSVLASNKYVGETFKFNDKIKIANGCRPLRALAKIAKAYNLPGFEDFRLAHSMVLNQKKLSGKLCLSIHPLDYITMSENDSSWTSCMNWNNRGCYRQGTVEMMNSPMVVVAYIASENDMHLTSTLSWNNKKWRQLFIVNEDFIGNIKAYPYRQDELTKICLSWLKELAEKAGFSIYTKNIIKYDHRKNFVIPELNNREIFVDTETYMMYNDFAENQFAYFNNNINDGWLGIEYSGANECMCCGKLEFSQDAEEMLVCNDCEKYIVCDKCGDSFYEADNEEMIEVDGLMYCQHCVENYCFVDFITNEIHDNNRLNTLYYSPDDGITLYDTYLPLDEETFNEWDMEEYFSSLKAVRHKSSQYYSSTLHYITYDDITKSGHDLLRENGTYLEEYKSLSWIEKVICDKENDEYYTVY